MTLASKITLFRIILVPVFALLAVYYSESVKDGPPYEEVYRYLAIIVFIIAAASDAVDGIIARHFNQQSKFGAFIDPIADKLLLLTGVIILSLAQWDNGDWRIPPWFVTLVIARDGIILGGILILYFFKQDILIKPHWTGKVCTFTQMFTIGWVMLKIVDLPPLYPTILAAVFTLWSGIEYVRQGVRILSEEEIDA